MPILLEVVQESVSYTHSTPILSPVERSSHSELSCLLGWCLRSSEQTTGCFVDAVEGPRTFVTRSNSATLPHLHHSHQVGVNRDEVATRWFALWLSDQVFESSFEFSVSVFTLRLEGWGLGWRMDNREASVPQGQKRRAEDSLEDEQRFSKRFNLLNLGMVLHFSSWVSINANLWPQNIPTSSTSQSSTLRRNANLAQMARRMLCS